MEVSIIHNRHVVNLNLNVQVSSIFAYYREKILRIQFTVYVTATHQHHTRNAWYVTLAPGFTCKLPNPNEVE